MTVIPSDLVDWTPEEMNIVNRDLEKEIQTCPNCFRNSPP